MSTFQKISRECSLSKMNSSSCDHLPTRTSAIKSTKHESKHKNRLLPKHDHFFSSSQKQPRINPINLSHQKSLLKKTNNCRMKKSFEYEDKNLKKSIIKFKEDFTHNVCMLNTCNHNAYDEAILAFLNEKEELPYTEETLKTFRKKYGVYELISEANLNNGNENDSITKSNGNANKYCIVSRRGTIRGTLNHVRDTIKQIFKAPRLTSPVLSNLNFNQNTKYYHHSPISITNHYLRDYEIEEHQKIVIYTTSLQVIRLSYNKCKRVKKILQSHCVKYEERDLYRKKEYQQELQYRLSLPQIDLPHLFFNGKYIGNCDQIESFSDQGLLKKLFKDLEKMKLRIYCEKCSGYRFVLCTICNGSKRKHNNFANLKCTHCNEDGLIRCDYCSDQQLI